MEGSLPTPLILPPNRLNLRPPPYLLLLLSFFLRVSTVDTTPHQAKQAKISDILAPHLLCHQGEE